MLPSYQDKTSVYLRNQFCSFLYNVFLFTFVTEINWILADNASVAESKYLETTDETITTETATLSHIHSIRCISRDFVTVCRCLRSDIKLGWSAVDNYSEIDVFTGYSGISDITELNDDSDILDFFNCFMAGMIHHIKEQINVYK